MKPQIATWDSLGPIDGPVLLVLNNRDVGDAAAGALWDELTRHAAAGAIHVAADRAWSGWIAQRGVSPSQVKFAVDRFGAALEINYFLEQPETVRWVARTGVRTIAGSAPHNLYNEEVQHVFERRAALLIGEHGRLLAHTLPQRYVYLFGVADLLDRIGRDVKVAAYEASVGALIGDLHRLWTTLGKPATADGGTYEDVRQMLSAHFGEAILRYDEESPIPIPAPSPSPAVAGLIGELRDAYVRLAEEHARRTAAVAIKDDARDLLRRLRGRRT